LTEAHPTPPGPPPRSFERLLADGVVVFDGAMGTEIYRRGVFINRCFDELNLSEPEVVREVHRSYVQAGVDVIETNSFGANRFKLDPYGFRDRVGEINRAAAAVAREVAGGRCLVAGAIGPLGLKIEPWGPTSVEEAEEAFHEQAAALLEAGVDLFVLETFSDLNEIRQAIKAIHRLCSLPIVAQMTLEEDGSSLYGTQPEVFTTRLDEWGADVIGCNCSVGPQVMLDTLERMAKVTKKPLSAQPNAGMPRNVGGRNIYLASPDYFGSYARRFVRAGARVVGGCCGTHPEHMKAILRVVRENRIGRIERPRVASVPSATLIPSEVQPVPRAQKSALAQRIAAGNFVVGAELLPPRGIDIGESLEEARALKDQGVDAIVIPEGMRASARMSATYLAVLIEREVGVQTVLHFTCRDRNLMGMQADLLGAFAVGLRNLIVVTGDPARVGDYADATQVFDVDSIGLANVVNRLNHGLDLGGNSIGNPTAFHLGVALNPGAIDLAQEIHRFEFKVEAGAEFAATRPIFDIGLLKDCLKRISHARIPVLAGLVPLASLRHAEYMNNEVAGCRVPDELVDRMRAAEEAGRAHDEGLRIAREILEGLRPLVQGVFLGGPLGRDRGLLETVVRSA
jgi:homocysteine S-methyltransferase